MTINNSIILNYTTQLNYHTKYTNYIPHLYSMNESEKIIVLHNGNLFNILLLYLIIFGISLYTYIYLVGNRKFIFIVLMGLYKVLSDIIYYDTYIITNKWLILELLYLPMFILIPILAVTVFWEELDKSYYWIKEKIKEEEKEINLYSQDDQR